jgi:hypothetical protein
MPTQTCDARPRGCASPPPPGHARPLRVMRACSGRGGAWCMLINNYWRRTPTQTQAHRVNGHSPPPPPGHVVSDPSVSCAHAPGRTRGRIYSILSVGRVTLHPSVSYTRAPVADPYLLLHTTCRVRPPPMPHAMLWSWRRTSYILPISRATRAPRPPDVVPDTHARAPRP